MLPRCLTDSAKFLSAQAKLGRQWNIQIKVNPIYVPAMRNVQLCHPVLLWSPYIWSWFLPFWYKVSYFFGWNQLTYDERPVGLVAFSKARLLVEVRVVGHEEEAPTQRQFLV